MSSPPNPSASTAFGAVVRGADRGVYGFRGRKHRRTGSRPTALVTAPSELGPDCDVSSDALPRRSVLARKRVVFEAIAGDLTLSEFAGIDVDGAAMLEGSPSVGMLSSIAAKHLVSALELPLCATINSPQLPPGCAVSGGVPTSPMRVYGDRRLVVFLSDFRLPIGLLNSYIELMVHFASRHSVRMVYALEGKPDNKLRTRDGAEIDLNECLMPPHMRAGSDDGRPPAGPYGLLEMDRDRNSTGSSPDDRSRGRAAQQRSRAGTAKSGGTSESTDSDSDSDAGDVDVQVHFVTTSDAAAASLVCCGAEQMIDGAIDGITGALLARATTNESLNITALLIKANTLLPDARAAATAVTLLGVLEECIPSEAHAPLSADAVELETRLVRSARAAPPPPSMMGMYV